MWPEQADSLAADLLGKLRTTLGGLQIAHARRVAVAVLGADDSRVTCAALLHDVVEKTEITVDDLLARTGDVEVVRLVGILTRRDGDSDTEYLTRCAADPLTLLVKRADLADKLEADDTTVPDAAAEQIRNQARERLLLLDLLATQARD
jgi:(p)ppGpp synthase/HD superfamily hydrolase